MGITRIHIVSDWKSERIDMSRDLEVMADGIYYDVFNKINMPLEESIKIIECTKDEAISRYDWQEGIDCILNFANGHRATIQEKLLEYWQSTVTFTEHQKNNVPGNWYTCTAQYWLTAYANNYKASKGMDLSLRDWMLIDLSLLKRLDATGYLPWKFKDNNDPRYLGIRFRYLRFDEVPHSAVVARCNHNIPLQIGLSSHV